MPPISEDILLCYVAHCYKFLSLKYSTIKLYLCGIRFHYMWKGKNPFVSSVGCPLDRLSACLRAVKRIQGTPSPKRLPITGDLLHLMCSSLQNDMMFSQFTCCLLHAVFTIAFYGFLRCGEFTVDGPFDPAFHLCIQDVEFCTDPRKVLLTLKASKTDPFRQGVTIQLFAINGITCPYTALQNYYLLRLQHHAPLSMAAPLFVTESGDPLSRPIFLHLMQTVLQQCHIPVSGYSGHSFRIGAATSAATGQVEDHLIKLLGRWSSDCYQRYIRVPWSAVKQAQTSMAPLSRV